MNGASMSTKMMNHRVTCRLAEVTNEMHGCVWKNIECLFVSYDPSTVKHLKPSIENLMCYYLAAYLSLLTL